MSYLQARVQQAVDQLVESGAERGMLAVVSGPAPLGLTSCCNKVSNYQAGSWGALPGSEKYQAARAHICNR